MVKGRLIEAQVINVRIKIDDGQYHAVDSSDKAFQAAARCLAPLTKLLNPLFSSL